MSGHQVLSILKTCGIITGLVAAFMMVVVAVAGVAILFGVINEAEAIVISGIGLG